jgi:hypothetical protein
VHKSFFPKSGLLVGSLNLNDGPVFMHTFSVSSAQPGQCSLGIVFDCVIQLKERLLVVLECTSLILSSLRLSAVSGFYFQLTLSSCWDFIQTDS